MRFSLLVFLLAPALPAPAQSPRAQLRSGDAQYEKKEYKKAEEHYRKALDAAPDNPEATYNTGNAIYQQGRYDQSVEYFEKAARAAKTPAEKADALHNLGNAHLKKEQLEEAVSSYKNSLLQRPGDPETRQNLELAKKRLEKKKQQQQQQNQDKKDPKQQKKQQQNQQQNQQQQQEQQQQQQQKQQQQNRQQQGQMTPEQARRLLETAIEPEDQKNAKKYRQQPRARAKNGKDW